MLGGHASIDDLFVTFGRPKFSLRWRDKLCKTSVLKVCMLSVSRVSQPVSVSRDRCRVEREA